MPDVGTIVITPEGKGTVVEVFTIIQMVKVKVKLEDDTDDLLNYKVDEIIITKEKDPQYKVDEEEVELDSEE